MSAVAVYSPNSRNVQTETYESESEYDFYVNDTDCRIYVLLTTQTSSVEVQNNNGTVDKSSSSNKRRKKEHCIAKFSVKEITKVITDVLNNDVVQYKLHCLYIEEETGVVKEIDILLNEKDILDGKLDTVIKRAFGDRHIPFPPGMDEIRKQYLAEYILTGFKGERNEKYNKALPEANDLSKMSDAEKKIIVKDFGHLFNQYNAKNTTEILLASGFYALIGGILYNSFNLCFSRTIVVYGYKDIDTRNKIAALTSTIYENTVMHKLSEVTVTKNKDELKEIFFNNQYRVVCFMDDITSNYAKTNNLKKVQRITEYVSGGIVRAGKDNIPCMAVVFANQRLMAYKEFAGDCIFVNADKVDTLEYNSDDIKAIVSDFLSIIYSNIGFYISHYGDAIEKIIKSSYGSDLSKMWQEIAVRKIYHDMAVCICNTFGIDAEMSVEETSVLRRCSGRFSHRESLYEDIFSADKIISDFKCRLNQLVYQRIIKIKLYDKSQTDANKVMLYEYDDEVVMLFSNNYFESLFSSAILESKPFRELLNENGCIKVNNYDKCNFRLPVDDRKSYIAVRTDILYDDVKKILPDLHPMFLPYLNDGTDRVYLADTQDGKPIYWPVGKMENKSVLIQGNKRTGKTYMTTQKVINGLHNLGYRIVIFDSAASSYSKYEIGKCGFDEAYISDNFYHGIGVDEDSIMDEITSNPEKIYVVGNMISDAVKLTLCEKLFCYQECEFDRYLDKTKPLFIVFDEIIDNKFYDLPKIKAIYNQGSKHGLNVITVLQNFSGKGSREFRKTVNQASLKISFRCDSDYVKYFTDSIPPEMRNTVKNKLPLLKMGEAVICGDFENSDSELSMQCFITKKSNV
jgi:hypothetical protein